MQPPQTNGTVAKEATDKLAELITRQLLFPVHMHLDILAINARDGEHELPLTLRAEELKADLTNVTPAPDALGCQPTLTLGARHTQLSLEKGSEQAIDLINTLAKNNTLTNDAAKKATTFVQLLDSQQLTVDLKQPRGILTLTLLQTLPDKGATESSPRLETQARKATIQVQHAQLTTAGPQQGAVDVKELSCQVEENAEKTLTVETRADKAALQASPRQLALPTTDVTLHGSVNATVNQPNITLERQGTQLKPAVRLETFTAEVPDTLTIQTGQTGIVLDKGTALTKTPDGYTLNLPGLTIDSPDGHGPIQLSGITVAFQPQPLTFHQENQQTCPVVAIAALTGTLTYPLAGGQSVTTDIKIHDLEIMAKIAWGEILQTLSEGRSTTIEPRNMTFKPEDLWVNSQSITVGLHRDAARAVARAILIHSESSVLDEASKLLEETIAKNWLFPVHIGCNILVVKGDEELPFAAHVDQLKMELTGVSPASESLDCKPTLTIDANHTELNLQQGSDLAREMAKELSTKDPLSALTGLSAETNNRMKPELHSQQLTINLSNLHGEVSQSLTQNSSSHDAHQKLLTQNRHAKVNVQTVSFINEGLPACALQLNGLNCHIKQNQQKNVTVNASSHSGEVDIKSEMLPLPTEMSASILNGQASAGYTDLNIKLKRPADGAYLETDVTAASMTAKVKDTLTVGDLKSGASFPKEMTMKASGTLFHCDKDKVFLSPQLQFSGNSNAVIIKDGQPITFYLQTDTQIKDASYIQFSNKLPLSDIKNTTRVVSGGDYLIKDTKIGPARVNSLHLAMDKNLNGHLKADEASADLDQLLQIMAKKKPARWYTRLFLKKKELTCSLATPIHQGNTDLKQLKITKLKFNPKKRANLLDRIICKVLNWFACPLIKRHCKLSTKLRSASKRESQNNPEGLIPVLGITVWPFRTSFNLPVPTTVIDYHTSRLSIAGALHEYGIQLIRPEYIELITTQLEIIKKSSSDTVTKALKSLLQLAKETASTPDHAGAMTLMARQWPLDSITNLLTTKPLPVELIDSLFAIIKLFSSIKEAHVTALLLTWTLKDELADDRYQQVMSDFSPELISDPLALALHSEFTGSSEKAKSAYEAILTKTPSHPIANVRIACLLLANAERNNDTDTITSAMNRLLKSALSGNESARTVIMESVNSNVSAIRNYAHLYAAAWYLKTENNQKDFFRAIDHLESIPQSTDAYQRAINLLECRQQNAQVIIHTASKEKLTDFRVTMKSINTDASKTHTIPAPDAYSLGIRMLYGADGIPYNPDQAKLLLQQANEDEGYENQARLHLKVCNLAVA